jgi:hypothetical protein
MLTLRLRVGDKELHSWTVFLRLGLFPPPLLAPAPPQPLR